MRGLLGIEDLTFAQQSAAMNHARHVFGACQLSPGEVRFCGRVVVQGSAGKKTTTKEVSGGDFRPWENIVLLFRVFRISY